MQKVKRAYQWVECGANPQSDNGSIEYYEIFWVEPPVNGVMGFEFDIMSAQPPCDDLEYGETVRGEAKFIPLNNATRGWMMALASTMRNAEANFADAYGNPIIGVWDHDNPDENGDAVLQVIEGPCGEGVILGTGGAPNDTLPPALEAPNPNDPDLEWGNNYNDHAYDVPDHWLEWMSVCCVNEKWVVTTCGEGPPITYP